jgi:hypothetical protein
VELSFPSYIPIFTIHWITFMHHRTYNNKDFCPKQVGVG